MPEMDSIQRIGEQHLAELEAKYKRIKVVEYNGHTLIFRAPTRAEAKQHAAKLENPQSKTDADEQLAQATVIHVDGEEDQKAARQALKAFKASKA